jgi:hypothetical protein
LDEPDIYLSYVPGESEALLDIRCGWILIGGVIRINLHGKYMARGLAKREYVFLVSLDHSCFRMNGVSSR